MIFKILNFHEIHKIMIKIGNKTNTQQTDNFVHLMDNWQNTTKKDGYLNFDFNFMLEFNVICLIIYDMIPRRILRKFSCVATLVV